MRFRLVTPSRELLDLEVEEVYAPGVLGQFGVLPLHANFLTALEPGELRYRASGKDYYVAVSGGVCEVLDDVVTVLADAAEPIAEIDVDRARASETAAVARLDEIDLESPEGIETRAALARARNRLEVAKRA
jgi:F-type H+-transporting ATPase subunit epsilon